MNKDKSSFIPDWIETAPKEESYRSIFKWGDPKGFKHPNKALYDFMKETLGLTDDDFQKRENEGHEKVVCHDPVKLDVMHIEAIKSIVGSDNVTDDDYSRVKYSSGMTMIEVDKLRRKGNKSVADIVVHPRHKEDVQKIVTYCHDELIPIYAYGGGSSVNFGHMPVKGGISLVMKTHMNKIIAFNETDHTVRVQAGMMGPAFEEALNKAPENFSARKRYTCGHFPQSFEYSSVGGWVLTLGSGQQSSYYGDAYDLVCLFQRNRPAVPKLSVHPFRRKSSTCSEANRPLNRSEATVDFYYFSEVFSLVKFEIDFLPNSSYLQSSAFLKSTGSDIFDAPGKAIPMTLDD